MESLDGGSHCKYLHISSSHSWTPKVCRIMAFWAIFRGFGPLFYLVLGVKVTNYYYYYSLLLLLDSYCLHTVTIILLLL